ncbi:MAG: putative glycoside hydrolase [Ignavibacteria bacterium]|nr:putative glycoside hydrolase [Ignavibacteria bacterium]
MICLVLLLFLISSVSSFSQPKEYLPRGYKSYLVNYWAIKGDVFLTKLAYKRFAFLDEASKAELKLIRSFDKDYIILFYKDVVALNYYLEEYPKINLEEDAFLHISEPSCLTVTFDKSWKFYWMPDRRFELDTNVKISYKLYWSKDSIDNYLSTDTIVKTNELAISLPKSARWVKLNTIVNDTLEIPYSFPIELRYEEGIPICLPETIQTKKTNNSTQFDVVIKFVSKTYPDSMYFYADLNKNNKFDQNEIIIIPFSADNFVYSELLNYVVNAGIECYIVCFKKGKQYRYPKVGFWTNNANNRVKNDYYNFFVMDVTNEKWRRNYIEQVQKAFARGYNGVFADDAWNRISNWGVDCYPPLNYSDSIWYDGVYNFLYEVKKALGSKPLIFNGLYESRGLRFLEVSDGGMDEGFAHNHWSGYVTETNWLNACNRGIKCENQYKKMWLPLSGILDKLPQSRIYCVSSFLLTGGKNSAFGNSVNYQVFAHFPEFDIPVGNALENATDSIQQLQQLDKKGKKYFKREFDNCVVYVNSNAKDTVVIPTIQGMPEITVDTLLSIEGGRLFTKTADSILFPKSAKIILKGKSSKLTSPMIKNPSIIIESAGKNEIAIRARVECADSSSNEFKSRPNLPLYVYVDLTTIGILEDLVLKNDGSPANEVFSEYSGEIKIPVGAKLRDLVFPIVAMSSTGLMTINYVNPKLGNIDTSNFVPNFSFEYDVDMNGIPDNWYPYYGRFEYDTTGLNAQHFKRSVKVTNTSSSDTGGVYTVIYLNQTEAKPILVAGWSKAEGVSGQPGYNYAIYCDFYSKENKPWYGRIAKFSTGTHDWEYSGVIYVPPFPIYKGNVYCLFRGHTGTVWFDNIFVGEVDTSTTSVQNKCGISIQVPSIVTGNETEVILINSMQSINCKLFIYNLLGNKLYESSLIFNSETKVIPIWFLTSSFTNGTYFLKLEIDGQAFVFPFLIIK